VFSINLCFVIVGNSKRISIKLTFLFLHKLLKIVLFLSSQTNHNKSHESFKLEILAATLAEPHNLNSSCVIFKSEFGHSGFNLFTSQ
jgi:hypothetical protein